MFEEDTFMLDMAQEWGDYFFSIFDDGEHRMLQYQRTRNRNNYSYYPISGVALTFEQLMMVVALLVVSTLWNAICWFQWSKKVYNIKPSKTNCIAKVYNPVHALDSTLCDCFSEKDSCIHAFCCPLFRMIDTWTAAGLIDNPGFFCLCLGLFPGYSQVLLAPFFRHQLRKKIGSKEEMNCSDFWVWWFCCFCAAAQEARQIDGATGIKTELCCKLTEAGKQVPVGDPTKIGSNL